MPNLTEKVLPLTVLLASIITFGNLAENYEFAAMKASGISLQRSMLPLIIFVSLLGLLTFYFANTVIPISEQKIYNLRRNIATLKPAAVITEGVFSDFEGRTIKVDRKYGENDRFLENVVIHEKSSLQKNITVIKAEEGELISSEGSEIIQLILRNGNYYHDVHLKSGGQETSHPFAKAYFDTYIINMEVPQNMQDLEADQNIETDKMKNVNRLITDIDSIYRHNAEFVEAFSQNISSRNGAFPERSKDSLKQQKSELNNGFEDPETSYTGTSRLSGSGSTETATIKKPVSELTRANNVREIDSVNPLESFKTYEKGQLLDRMRNNTRNILNTVKAKRDELESSYKRYNLHILSLHRKFALALSCIILFFVGAPLGAIIRKGGIGLPLVIAIVLFLAYYFFGVFAGNYAKEGNIHPVFGAWLPTLIMLPLGIWLTRRATADKGLVQFGQVLDWFRGSFKIRILKKSNVS
ncbi:MAG: hypothetical protein RLZZ241_1827 [Bacteroidota bacterium]